MTLPFSWSPRQGSGSWCIAKRNGVSSRASLLISLKCLWVTLSPLVTTPGQCPLTSLLKEKTIRIKDKRHEWALQRHPQVSHTFPCYHCTHCPDIPYHLIHLHGLDLTSPENIPHPMSIRPIGHPSVPSVAVLIHTCKRELSSAHLVCPWRHNAEVHNPRCHFDQNLFHLGLLLGKPKGVDLSY
jgi:hypothetical protein